MGNSTLAVTPACLSSFQAVDSPHDDRWFLYASWEKDDDNDGIDFCRGDIDSVANGAEYRTAKLEARTAGLLQNRSSYPYFPIMGREDWIEPVEGRRHMGYESCNGYPTEASSSVNSSETSIVVMLLTFG